VSVLATYDIWTLAQRCPVLLVLGNIWTAAQGCPVLCVLWLLWVLTTLGTWQYMDFSSGMMSGTLGALDTWGYMGHSSGMPGTLGTWGVYGRAFRTRLFRWTLTLTKVRNSDSDSCLLVLYLNNKQFVKLPQAHAVWYIGLLQHQVFAASGFCIIGFLQHRVIAASGFCSIGFLQHRVFAYRVFIQNCSGFCHIGFMAYRVFAYRVIA
jgi:hypothetical protein